jgi:hypothetical protein
MNYSKYNNLGEEQHRKAFFKMTIKIFIAAVVLLILAIIYFVFTGSFPSFNTETRYRDFAKINFTRKSDIYFKEVDTNGTGFKSYIAFEKSSYFKKVFISPTSKENIEKHVKDAFKARDQHEGKKLAIYKPIDLGILNPLIQLLIPFKKVFDVEIQDQKGSHYKIFNVESLDIDNDGKQEVIVHWLDYAGGSGGNFISAIISENNGEFKIVDFYPVFTPITSKDVHWRKEQLTDKNNFENENDYNKSKQSFLELKQFILQDEEEFRKGGYLNYVETEEYVFRVNGKKIKMALSSYHTDNFFGFLPLKGDGGYRLVSAQSFHDVDGHYEAQSWALTSFRLVGKKFVPDFEFEPTKVDKKVGWSIIEVHGYTTSSYFGLISYMLLPPWLEMQDRGDAIMKARLASVVTDYFGKKFRNQNDSK